MRTSTFPPPNKLSLSNFVIEFTEMSRCVRSDMLTGALGFIAGMLLLDNNNVFVSVGRSLGM